ncbi:MULTISPECIES: DUF2971 domain-containing protein [Bacillus cereus group]|uniref:DUF2971 domain-containing protein n=1 Tax=Bacillus cereus group TaxID=86661 RepID=UPI00159BA958|nr:MULTISPECIES: DUF2971 domain-containing protein [Bacillus cereus group]MDZ4541634.1 DUF2971 domain-containing protein [Bacillus cereus]
MEWKEKYIKLMYPSNMNNRREKEARELKRKNIPVALYKYRAVNLNSIRGLRRNEVWCNSADHFNDPYECALMIGDYAEESLKALMIKQVKEKGVGKLSSIVISNLEKMELNEICMWFAKLVEGGTSLSLHEHNLIYAITKAEYDIKTKNDLEKIVTQIKEKTKISCFSEVNDSILMWSHYADNHKGFCIEYNFNEIDEDLNLINALHPAIYSDEIINVGKHLKKTSKQPDEFNQIIEEYAAIVKSKEWEYEKEWRIVFCKDEGGGFNYRGLKPKAIYLGSRISKDDKSEILEIAKEKDINVFQMKTERNNFKLTPKLLS